jgi:hypothetical protein
MSTTSPPVPRKPAGVGLFGMLLALLLVALGVLLVHEGLALRGWIDGSPVLDPLLSSRAVVEPGPVTTLVAALAALLGLWLLVSAFRRGRRRGVELDAKTRVWMSHRDLDRLVTGTAEEVDGVLGAKASVGRRRAVVHVETTTPEVSGDVAAAVERRLAALDRRPSVDVRATPRHEKETR